VSEKGSFIERNHFLFRRLHSLSGIVPIGVFLIIHLLTNSSVIWGKLGLREAGVGKGFTEGGTTYFWEEVRWINTQIPHLLLTEILLWSAIAFHSVLGFYYATTASKNTEQYPYMGNRRYLLQRISGYFGIAFIFYHVATLRWGWSFLVPGGTKWSAEFASSTLAATLRGGEQYTAMGVAVSLFYFLGVSLLVFHFANGLWTAAIRWGLTVSRRAQVRWGYVCAAIGITMLAWGWSGVVGFAMLRPSEIREIELKLSGEGARETKASERAEPVADASGEPGAPGVTGAERSGG
jgi:succinate dehydrogenase / fumarate reductase cytochrome b subunit